MTREQYARYNKALAVKGGSHTEEDYARARRAAHPDAARAGDRSRAADLPSLIKEVGAACGSWSAAADFAVRAGGGKALVEETAAGFRADTAHRAALSAAPLSDGTGLAYLASCVHSAVNRLKGAVTDADDAKFQEALAAWAAEELTGR